jgi:hypothetical protein
MIYLVNIPVHIKKMGILARPGGAGLFQRWGGEVGGLLI